MQKLLSTLFLLHCLSAAAFLQVGDTRQLPGDYVSDNCSLFPDGNYADCCVAHDKDYFFGGTKAQRKASDERLKQCVLSKGSGWKRKFLATTIYLGVRIGGVGFLNAPFSWGFGKRWKKQT
ncbi:MAG: hypothetical protein IPO41_16060 [Acidobacteria bacterium]|nr:hypothetical protein [Acidobacteriota bacterium]MBK9529783.1 hypothetical protein [Acidobacteriota bacterium]MBP7475157.1 hypothetical protein [Pyrinomonadaceae bacterium]MBP9110217.1 hypothetical protein [Pyrinomonadaceae bacterium]